MFQLFWRPRAHNSFKIRLGDRNFRARSIDRDANTDRSRVNSILEVIENALSAAEQERSCLNRRVVAGLICLIHSHSSRKFRTRAENRTPELQQEHFLLSRY